MKLKPSYTPAVAVFGAHTPRQWRQAFSYSLNHTDGIRIAAGRRTREGTRHGCRGRRIAPSFLARGNSMDSQRHRYQQSFVGRRFHLLVAVSHVPPVNGNYSKMVVTCDCGTTKEVSFTDLVGGKIKSCGCICASRINGGSASGVKHPLYETWKSMRRRCLNPKCDAYPYYGGRGITVCERWLFSLDNFVADMGPKPSGKHTLDRIDPNGNYEPGNCRWATAHEQRINQRKKPGVNLSEISRATGIPRKTLENRIRRSGMSIADAIAVKKRGCTNSSDGPSI